MNNIIKLYLNEYDSVFDMAVDAVMYEMEGYTVYCYDDKGQLIPNDRAVK